MRFLLDRLYGGHGAAGAALPATAAPLTPTEYFGWGLLIVLVPLLGPFLVILLKPGAVRQKTAASRPHDRAQTLIPGIPRHAYFQLSHSMQNLRRLYIYAVAFVSLETVLWGAIGLARSFVGPGVVGSGNQLAEALSLILVGIPVFLLHWWWLAQRSATRQPGERSALLRAIFLYGILLATLLPVVQNALALLDRLLAGLFGLDMGLATLGGGQTLSDNLIAIAFNAVAAAYFYFVLRQDWKAGPLGDEFAEVRRLFRYIWVVYGLVIAGLGLQRSLESIFLWLGPRLPGYAYLLTSGLALLIIGAPLWAFSRWTVQRSLARTGRSGIPACA